MIEMVEMRTIIGKIGLIETIIYEISNCQDFIEGRISIYKDISLGSLVEEANCTDMEGGEDDFSAIIII